MYPIGIIRCKERGSEGVSDNFYMRNSHVTLKLTTIPKVCLINDNFALDKRVNFVEDESVTECKTLFFLFILKRMQYENIMAVTAK